MNNTYRIIAVMIILIISIQLCGFATIKPDIAIDTEKHHVYKHITAEDLLSELSADKKNAQNKYKNQYILLSGLFESADSNGNSFSIINSKYESINCVFEKKLNIDTSDYSFMDKVAVYGKCTFSFGKIKFTDVKKIMTAPVVRSTEVFYTLDETSFEKSTSLERTLNEGKVKYYIPSKWKDIEVNISEQGIGSIEGYQYVLNNTPGSSDAVPESFFICYFDKKLLKESADIKNTDSVEKAIIENIDGSVGKFPSYKVNTYYGVNYQYYLGKYTDAMETGKGYHTEYVFQSDGDRGIIMYLYLYRDAKHISDVMITTRLLEIME